MNYSVHRFVYPADERPGLATLDVTEIDKGVFYINRILVPESVRCQGIGGDLMCELQEKIPCGATVQVHPTRNYGSDLERLTAFFARHGFVQCGNGLMQWQA